jgi:hypothetical protein
MGDPKPLSQESRIFIYSPEFLEEIILGLNVSTADKNQIISIAREMSIPVYQVIRKNKSFSLSKEQIA